jgi:hypothetical protein
VNSLCGEGFYVPNYNSSSTLSFKENTTIGKNPFNFQVTLLGGKEF